MMLPTNRFLQQIYQMLVGNGTVKQKVGDTVRLKFIGYLYEESENANYHQGKQ